MVSIRRVFVIVLLIISKIQIIFWFKRGASLSPASRSKGPGIARLVETSNAESPTIIYIAIAPEQRPHNIRLQDMFGMQCIYTPQGVPVALFLTSHSNFPGS